MKVILIGEDHGSIMIKDHDDNNKWLKTCFVPSSALLMLTLLSLAIDKMEALSIRWNHDGHSTSTTSVAPSQSMKWWKNNKNATWVISHTHTHNWISGNRMLVVVHIRPLARRGHCCWRGSFCGMSSHWYSTRFTNHWFHSNTNLNECDQLDVLFPVGD